VLSQAVSASRKIRLISCALAPLPSRSVTCSYGQLGSKAVAACSDIVLGAPNQRAHHIHQLRQDGAAGRPWGFRIPRRGRDKGLENRIAASYRAGAERPGDRRRAAEERDELAPSHIRVHSITSSASAVTPPARSRSIWASAGRRLAMVMSSATLG